MAWYKAKSEATEISILGCCSFRTSVVLVASSCNSLSGLAPASSCWRDKQRVGLMYEISFFSIILAQRSYRLWAGSSGPEMSIPRSNVRWRARRASRSGGAIRLMPPSSPFTTVFRLWIISVCASKRILLNADISAIVGLMPKRMVPKKFLISASCAVVPGVVIAKLNFEKVAIWWFFKASNQGSDRPASAACCSKVASESKIVDIDMTAEKWSVLSYERELKRTWSDLPKKKQIWLGFHSYMDVFQPQPK